MKEPPSRLANVYDNLDCQVIKNNFETPDFYQHGPVTLIKTPFKCIKFKNVIQNNDKYLEKLKSTIRPLIVIKKSNDLYSLKQSHDLNNYYYNNKTIKKFIDFLKLIVQPKLETIFGFKFDDKISITASLYEKGDYLLCHDDKCEDRSIAFIYYLNHGNDNCGGCFDMFNHNTETGQPSEVVRSLPPEGNSFLCFEVGNYSYHQVCEVLDGGFKRLSINGWFHCQNRAAQINHLPFKDNPFERISNQLLLQGLVMLNDFISLTHCTPTFIEDVKETFENESQVKINNFFVKSFFQNCQRSLSSSEIKWLPSGPPNRRNYHYACLDDLVEPLDTLINLFKSSLFVSYLRSLTGLSLIPLGERTNINSCTKLMIGIEKWTSGCYKMATDDQFFNKDGLDVFVFFNCSNLTDPCSTGGHITYLSTDNSDDDSQDSELLTIEPSDNAFCAVYRTSDTASFTKYINSTFSGEFYCLSATYYE